MARPNKPTNEVLGTQVTIRLNNDLLIQLHDIATAENRSLAGHIRMLIETETARQQNILNKNYKLEFHEAG